MPAKQKNKPLRTEELKELIVGIKVITGRVKFMADIQNITWRDLDSEKRQDLITLKELTKELYYLLTEKFNLPGGRRRRH